jgi:DNA-binding MarR family transcriptional regulator
MSQKLREELQQKQGFESEEQAAFLSVQRTAGLWMQSFARNLRGFGLTPTQYNVLRILRGAHPESMTCGAIGERMVTPVPDVTRLVDRLVARDWVNKERDGEDRRVVRVKIADPGLHLLASLDGPVLAWLEELLAPLDSKDMETLSRILEKARS